MAGKNDFQLTVETLAKIVQDGTVVPILKPKMRAVVNGLITVLYVGGERTVVKVHDENFDLERGAAIAILGHCGFRRSTIRKLMESAEIQDMEGTINGYHCKN